MRGSPQWVSGSGRKIKILFCIAGMNGLSVRAQHAQCAVVNVEERGGHVNARRTTE